MTDTAHNQTATKGDGAFAASGGMECRSTTTCNARGASPYTTKEKIGRMLWAYLGQPLFRLTFHNWYGLRAAWLRGFGAHIAHDVRIAPSVRVEQPWNITIGGNTAIGPHAILYALGPITIGRNVSISQYAHLCAGSHDHTRADMPLLRPPITVSDEVWIAADAFIGPKVSLGEGCVIGARAAVFKDTQPWMIYVGNPAKPLAPRPWGSKPAPG